MKWFPILGSQESSAYWIFIIAELLKWTIRCQEMLIWASDECFFSARMWHCVVFSFLALYYRFQMLFIFILAFSALCFWWICASSDPSASYPAPWDEQGLIKASLQPVRDPAMAERRSQLRRLLAASRLCTNSVSFTKHRGESVSFVSVLFEVSQSIQLFEL